MTRGRKEKKTRSDNREYASRRHNTAEKRKGERKEEEKVINGYLEY